MGSPRSLDLILWQSKSLKVIKLGSYKIPLSEILHWCGQQMGGGTEDRKDYKLNYWLEDN